MVAAAKLLPGLPLLARSVLIIQELAPLRRVSSDEAVFFPRSLEARCSFVRLDGPSFQAPVCGADRDRAAAAEAGYTCSCRTSLCRPRTKSNIAPMKTPVSPRFRNKTAFS